MSALHCMSCFYITRKLQQNSLTVSRNDREKLFGLLMLKICVIWLNKLLYSKWTKFKKEVSWGQKEVHFFLSL